MTYEAYRYIFIGAAILSAVMLVAAVLIFIFKNIPKVISDLTGATARKAIKNIREQNEASGDKAYKVSAFNEARGKLTDKISPSGNVIQQNQIQMRGIDTTKISTQELVAEEPEGQTTVLEQYNETTVLSNGAAGETSVLSTAEQMNSETTILNVATETFNAETTVLNNEADAIRFSVEYEITYVHTNEVIA